MVVTSIPSVSHCWGFRAADRAAADALLVAIVDSLQIPMQLIAVARFWLGPSAAGRVFQACASLRVKGIEDNER